MHRQHCEELIDEYGTAAVVDALGPFITPRRRERIDTMLHKRLAGIHIAIEAPCDPHNASAIVRTAEAFGVLGVHVIAAEGKALHTKRTTQGAYHWVETHHHTDFSSFLDATAGIDRYGAWMDAPMTVQEIPVDRPLCLLLGNENRGLSPQARQACRSGYRIPMVGMSESLNLSVSAAISLFEVCRNYREEHGPTDVPKKLRERLRARHYIECVDDRMVDGVLREHTALRSRLQPGRIDEQESAS
jgi:tRNA (guanosine-2'-O-)-methyltransferase